MFVLNDLPICAFRKHQGGGDHLVVVFGGGCVLRKKDMILILLNLPCMLRLGIVNMGIYRRLGTINLDSLKSRYINYELLNGDSSQSIIMGNVSF